MTDTVPALYLAIGGKRYEIATYADASEMVTAALAKYDGWYRDLPQMRLLNAKGKKIGHVSTNGRVWLGEVCVYSPPPYLPSAESLHSTAVV